MLNGRAYIAFTNNGNNALHLGWFNGSSQLQGGEIIRLGGVVQTAETGPALAADPANQRRVPPPRTRGRRSAPSPPDTTRTLGGHPRT